MKVYQIKYINGYSVIVSANSPMELIKKYDLATKEHINTRIIELVGDIDEVK